MDAQEEAKFFEQLDREVFSDIDLHFDDEVEALKPDTSTRVTRLRAAMARRNSHQEWQENIKDEIFGAVLIVATCIGVVALIWMVVTH